MLKRPKNTEIPIGFLFGTFFWIAVLGWATSYDPTNPEKEACYQSAAKSGRSTDECKSFWEQTTSQPVALFTLVLACSTIGLWIATGIGIRNQSRDTRILQRAYLSAEPFGINEYIGEGDKVIGHVTFRNAGHLPATGVKWFVDKAVEKEGERGGFFIDDNKFVGDNVISPGTPMIQASAPFERPKTGYIFVWGEVRYTDGFNKPRFTRFCHRYNCGAFESSKKTGRYRIKPKYARFYTEGNNTDEG